MTEATLWLWASGEALGGRLAGVSLAALGIALALHTLKLAVRARAWQNVLRAAVPLKRVCYSDAAVPYFAGLGASTVVPFGGGTVLRVVLARTRLRVSAGTIVGSIAVERALDIAVGAAIVSVAIVGGLNSRAGLHMTSLSAHAIALGAGAGALIAIAAGFAWLLRGRISALLLEFAHGLRALRSPRQYLLTVASWQLLSWALQLAALYWFLRAFHIPGGIATAVLVLALQVLVALLPLTPGGAGPQQAVIALALAGTASATALVGFSAGSQAATIVADLVLGVLALLLSGGSLRIRKLALEARPAVAATP